MENVLVGKRIKVGGAILSTATVIAAIWPAHAVAILAAATPLTFVAQIIVVNYFGVTTKKEG